MRWVPRLAKFTCNLQSGDSKMKKLFLGAIAVDLGFPLSSVAYR
jgi:hypothetical protein